MIQPGPRPNPSSAEASPPELAACMRTRNGRRKVPLGRQLPDDPPRAGSGRPRCPRARPLGPHLSANALRLFEGGRSASGCEPDGGSGARNGRQPAVAASGTDYCIAVAVDKPMHLDAHAARAAPSLRKAKQQRSRECEACSPGTVVPRASGMHGAAARRSERAWTRRRTDASRPALAAQPAAALPPGSWKQLRGRRDRFRRNPAAGPERPHVAAFGRPRYPSRRSHPTRSRTRALLSLRRRRMRHTVLAADESFATDTIGRSPAHGRLC